MTPEGHNDLFPALESALRAANKPLDCHELYEMPEIKRIAPSANRVSDYLGVLYRRGVLSRVLSDREFRETKRARWSYLWRDKSAPAWAETGDKEVLEFKPKSLVNRANVLITEDGGGIHIELPHMSITIKTK